MCSLREIRIYGVVKGYHAYRVKPRVGEVLVCKMEPENTYDKKAVRVVNKDGQTIGHVPAIPVSLNAGIFEILETWPAFPVQW